MSDRTVIGVRFCGGCNPRYDRSAALRELQRAFPRFCWEAVEPGKMYERVLLICGCVTACVTTKDLARNELIWLRRPEEKEHIKEIFHHL